MQEQAPGDNRGEDGSTQEWDANDPRRQHDQMAPPAEPCECFCLHCRRTFSSDLIWFQRIKGARDGFEGFWMCPTPNCDGAGFTFDIFPTDPDHPANEGWHYDDESEGEEAWDEEDDEWEYAPAPEEPEKEYDPAEPTYQMLDEMSGDDEDLEGEEWKFGLEPGERPKPDWVIEQERKYDEPDRRPREVDVSDSEAGRGSATLGEDDIPF